MKHLDLFSGIGGFKLAAEWAGFETVAFSEIHEWCDGILEEHWPEIPNIGDIRDADSEEIIRDYGNIDLITAGVPCQPASLVGKRQGVADDRWLWPETLKLISEIKPRWFVGENPRGILNLDNGDKFFGIIDWLRDEGYDCWWESLPATSVGGGHHRQRVWLVALSSSTGLERQPRSKKASGKQGLFKKAKNRHAPPKIVLPIKDSPTWWINQSPVHPVVDGVSDRALWTNQIEAVGNSIVPQVAYCILKSIITINKRCVNEPVQE